MYFETHETFSYFSLLYAKSLVINLIPKWVQNVIQHFDVYFCGFFLFDSIIHKNQLIYQRIKYKSCISFNITLQHCVKKLPCRSLDFRKCLVYRKNTLYLRISWTNSPKISYCENVDFEVSVSILRPFLRWMLNKFETLLNLKFLNSGKNLCFSDSYHIVVYFLKLCFQQCIFLPIRLLFYWDILSYYPATLVEKRN